MGKLEGRVAIVTGGSRVIGKAIDRGLAEVAVLIASQQAHINMLEAIVLPVKQPCLSRG